MCKYMFGANLMGKMNQNDPLSIGFFRGFQQPYS